MAADVQSEAATIIGGIAGKLATRGIETPVQTVALILRVTGWVLEHEITHYVEMLEQANVGVDPARASELVVSQLVGEGARTELHDLIFRAFPELLASEGFREELRLVIEVHEQPAQEVDPPDQGPTLSGDDALNRVRGRRMEEAAARQIERDRPLELEQELPGRRMKPPSHGP